MCVDHLSALRGCRATIYHENKKEIWRFEKRDYTAADKALNVRSFALQFKRLPTCLSGQWQIAIKGLSCNAGSHLAHAGADSSDASKGMEAGLDASGRPACHQGAPRASVRHGRPYERGHCDTAKAAKMSNRRWHLGHAVVTQTPSLGAWGRRGRVCSMRTRERIWFNLGLTTCAHVVKHKAWP